MVASKNEQLLRLSGQVREDLTGQLAGEIRTDLATLSAYATDASLHQLMPTAVAFPRNVEDVATIIRYANDQQIPIIARGAGTGLAGNSLGAGIIIDFSRHMNQILQIKERSVVVQPGVVLKDLNKALLSVGRHFAPDPSNEAITTIGGMIGVDAAGSRALRIGSTRDHLKKLQLVLADGTIHWLGLEPVHPGVSSRINPLVEETHDQYTRIRVILKRLAAILKENETLIDNHQPLMLRNTAGYMLRGILRKGYIDLPRLIAGSEGTLGLCTEIELHTSPLPQHRKVLLLLFSRFDLATKALLPILEFQPAACDLLDRRLITLARESSAQYEKWISPHAEAAMIVEFVGRSAEEVQRIAEKLKREFQQNLPGISCATETSTEQEANELWKLPRQVVPLLARIKGRTRPVPIIEDIVIPPQQLGEFLHQAQRVLQRFQVTASLYAHAGSGQLHLRPFLEPPGVENKSRFEALSRDLYRVVLENKGSISGEHGDGFSRTAFIRTQYGPLYRVFQQIKTLFDPLNLLNPDKIVSGDPHLTIRHLRQDTDLVELKTDTQHQLTWKTSELAQVASHCNGCGQCKTGSRSQRMCPFHKSDIGEFTSPRAKANIVRQYLQERFLKVNETLPQLEDFTNSEILDSCFNCKQCQLECPSQVDIPHLWLEAKAAAVHEQGLSRSEWYMSRIETLAGLGWRAAWLVNFVFRTKAGRWLLEKICGIDQRRQLPRLASRPYLQQLKIRKRKRKTEEKITFNTQEKPVILFLDYYANYHDPQIIEALEAILRHHQIPYEIPTDQEVSGMTRINAGDLTAAREIAEINLRILGPYAREGHPILCIEPASAVCFSQEYPLLIEHPDVNSLAKNVYEAGGYLQKLHSQGLLKTDFAPLPATIAYHEPCHQRALGSVNPYQTLLNEIPELKFLLLDRGCSGMAGTFGLTKQNFQRSLEMGAELIDAVLHENFTVAASECAACRLQMLQPDVKPVIHPLKLIAAAYRLIPLPVLEVT